jgi:primosomal protein N' (replication factor Y)
LPFADLGFVIVDEEHEQTFNKLILHPDIMPVMQLLYWLVLAKVLLGSATPSIETYFNGKSEYGLVEIKEGTGM